MHWFLGNVNQQKSRGERKVLKDLPPTLPLEHRQHEARCSLGVFVTESQIKIEANSRVSHVNYWLLEPDLCHPPPDLFSTWFTRFFHSFTASFVWQIPVSDLHSSKGEMIDLMYSIWFLGATTGARLANICIWNQERLLNVSPFKALNINISVFYSFIENAVLILKSLFPTCIFCVRITEKSSQILQ